LDVEIDLRANLVFRGAVFFARVGVGVMDRAAVAAGYNHSLASLFLNVVEKVYEDGIDVFFILKDGKAVAGASFAIEARGWLFWIGSVDERRVKGVAFATEELFCNPGEVGLRFPRIGRTGSMGGGCDGVEKIVPAPVNILSFAVAAAQLFSFRLLHAGTPEREEEQQ
jgi:hypothetical protein